MFRQPRNMAVYEPSITDSDRTIGEAIVGANTLRFDASDAMPSVVGRGSFWKEITSYVASAEDVDTVLKNTDASWPK